MIKLTISSCGNEPSRPIYLDPLSIVAYGEATKMAKDNGTNSYIWLQGNDDCFHVFETCEEIFKKIHDSTV